MDTSDESGSPVTDRNGDVSLQAIMALRSPPDSPRTIPALSELRLVLLGRKGTGKSAAGNTILGGAAGFESGKPTEECVKRRADVSGRRITVVDTPGWEWYYPLNSTPNWVRRETLRSVSLCPPGPHAVLLVVRSCTSVADSYISEIEEHLEPLGKEVWEYTLVLFTRGDELGLGKMEQRILTSGTGLQRLLQKCGNRYHVVNNRSKGDVTQVKELIGKLEKMVDGKKEGNGYLKLDNGVLLGLEADGKRRARERRKKQRQMEAHIQRGTIKAALMNDGPQGSELDAHQSFSKAPRRLPEIRLVLLGERETGKSSAGNVILGRNDFFQAGAVTEECARQQAEVSTRAVTVVDTPGWEAGVDGVTPERVKREIVSSVALCPPGPHALLLTLRVDTLQKAGHVKEHLELLGEGAWRHTVVLFTHGDQLREGVKIEQHIQSGGKDLQWLLEKCRGRYHVVCGRIGDGGGGGGSAEVADLLEKVEKMAMTNRCEAFSGLVQEVRDASRQRNEKFNLRLKEMADKMLRQEAELKKMRDREVKSIRWFFERKRKVKSPEKADVPKEDEDRRVGDAKNDMGELEERIRWLAEDREREIQDLSVENERIRAALNQSQQEERALTLQLEVKEREIEELTERTDEQQIKLLDLEQSCAETERRRKQSEDAQRAEKHRWTKHQEMLEETIAALKKDEAKWIVRIEALQVETEQVEEKLFEKEQEQEELKKHAREREEEMKRQHDEEMEKQMRDRNEQVEELKRQHREEAEQKSKEMKREKETETERTKRNCEDEMKNMQRKQEEAIAELKKEFETKIKEQTEAKKKETAEMEQMYLVRVEEKIQESEEEKQKIYLCHKKEMEEKMEQAEKREEALKMKHEEEMRVKSNEMEEKNATHREEVNKIVQDAERIQQDLMEKMSFLENERRVELDEVREKFRREKEKQLEEKQKWMEDVREKRDAQMEENQLERTNQLEKLRENEKTVEELKRQLRSKTQDAEKEKEKKEKKSEEVKEKESEIEEMKLSVEELEDNLLRREETHKEDLEKMKAMERDLREKDEEMKELKDKLSEKEKVNLNQEKEAKQQMETKNKETAKLEERINELQKELLETKEEKERENLCSKKQIAQVTEENRKEINKLNHRLKEVDERGETIQQQKREAERKLEDAEREMEEMRKKVKEKETEMESVKRRADSSETKWREELKRNEERGANEINKLLEALEKKTKELTRVQNVLTLREGEVEACAKHKRETEELSEKLRRKEETVELLLRKDGENEKEAADLRLTIEQTKSELRELTVKMEREMTSMIEEYEKEMARKNEDVRAATEEKERDRRSEEESRRSASAIAEKYEASREAVKELRERNEKLQKESGNLREKFERLQKSEEEKREDLRGFEEKVKNVEALLEERNVEVLSVRDSNDKLYAELEGMKGKREEMDERMKRLKQDFDRKLKESEQRLNGEDAEQTNLRAKEEVLNEMEASLKTKEQELHKLQNGLETRQKEQEEIDKRLQDLNNKEMRVRKMESEMETLLEALEGKQRELSFHGQDLQKKVKGLKDHGRELKDREHHLKTEEQELLNWKSELELRNEHVNCTTQELDEMRRGLALLKDELTTKEMRLKESLDKMGKWEQNLKEREEELHKRKTTRGTDDNTREENFVRLSAAGDNVSFMCRELSRGKEKGKGKEAEECAEDQGLKTTLTASMTHKSNQETLTEMKVPSREKDTRSQRTEKAPLKSVRLNKRNFSELEFRVIILGETWSSRSPPGLTIFSGESPEPDRSTFRSWRGQTAGRRLVVSEPLGLRWRDGPEPAGATQRKNLLDSVAWCNPDANIILLLIPAFLTFTQKYRRAVEEHVRLLGEDPWRRTLVLFTWGEILGESPEQHILRNGELLGLVEKCGGRYHVLTSKKDNSTIEGLFEKMEQIVTLNGRK